MVWYNISAKQLAEEMTLRELQLDSIPASGKDRERFESALKDNILKARGIKYGDDSYSRMYMQERERILGDWESFLDDFCRTYEVNTSGEIFVAGINDGQEVGFLNPAKLSGLDISESAVVRGRKKYSHINFYHCNLAEFDMAPEALDTYFSFRTMHIFTRREAKSIILRAMRFLKESGKIVISVPGGYLAENGRIVFGQKLDGDRIDLEKPLRDAERIKALLDETGFVSTQIINHKIEIFVLGVKP